MGRRKLHFDVRKNWERKKAQWNSKLTISTPVTLANDASPSQLIVKLPLSAYTSSTVPDASPSQFIVKLPLSAYTSSTVPDASPSQFIVKLPLSAYTSSTVPDASALYSRLTGSHCIPPRWTASQLLEADSQMALSSRLALCKLQALPPLFIPDVTLMLALTAQCTWTLKIGRSETSPRQCQLLNEIASKLCSVDDVLKLLSVLPADFVGNPDAKFKKLACRHKGNFKDQSGTSIVAYHDTQALPHPTIRHSECPLIIADGAIDRCEKCADYRSTLHALTSRESRSATRSDSRSCPSSHANYRYLSTPEKIERLCNLHHESRISQRKVERLRDKLAEITEQHGVTINEETTSDLHEIMQEEEQQMLKKFPQNSFQHVFWQQQKENASRKDKRGIRWHPLMIKWCLYLRHQSNKAYETLRQSGCLQLPSQRTLRDYTHYTKSGAGFSTEVDRQLMQAANLASCNEWQKLVILLLDEMHIMVRGLFTPLRFAYVQFPCAAVTGDLLFHPFWQAVYRLERMGLKVLGATADGASVNRRLVKLHNTSDKLIYKVLNIHASDGRELYFFSDPPHLIKTTRNCWLSNCRSLWLNGNSISWQHLVALYERDGGKGTGLALVPKLKFEHLHLSSFAKMRVDLAAQVLSESVSKALLLTGGPEVKETSEFASMFDKFFDAFNVSNFTNGTRYRKPFQHPYRHGDDIRLKWLENDFLPYLDKWEKCVKARKGFSDAEKKRMMLSDETLLGLRRTAKSFVGLVRYLFSLPEVKENRLAFLSQHLCQDPLENFFGSQRQRGGTSDNPNAQEFFHNTQALRVVNSFCRGPARGNCRGSQTQDDIDKENTPLPRRRRQRCKN